MADSKHPPKPAAQKVEQAEKKMRDLTAAEQSEFDQLNEVMANIQHTVRPAPYIISTPSLDPYNHRDRESATSFMMGTLWGHDEAHLQYRTFKYREPYQDIFVMQTGEEVEPEPERPQSQASNTSRQGPKKKITLSAYKEKKKGGSAATGGALDKPSPSLVPTKPTAEQPRVQKKQNGEAAASTAQKVTNGVSTKRPASEDTPPERAEKRRREQNEAPVRQPKHHLPSPKDGSNAKKSPDRSVASNASPHGLPPMLSPIGESLQNPHNLPPILSPTLPANIQAELDRLETQRKRTDSNASTSSSDRKSQHLTVPETDAPKRQEPPKVESKIHTPKVEKTPNTPVPKSVEPPSGPTLLVKLKIGKHLKKRAADLLRLPPKPCAAVVAEKKERDHELMKELPEVEKPRQKANDVVPTKAKDVPKIIARNVDAAPPRTKATSTTNLKPAEKRPRVEDDASLAVPAKRPRASTLDRPSTPVQQATTSPSLSIKSSAQKNGTYTTPRKDLKSISMSRMNSAEGFDSTPGRSGATPAGKLQNGKIAPTSAPVNGKVQADIQALSQASMKFNALGRSLKHEVQKIMKDSGDRPSRKDAERAAITSVECILSYMTAYQVQDRSTHLRGRSFDVENTWVTLLPLCMSYAVRTKDFPYLDGIRLHLCSVISATICGHVSNRARAYSPKDAPTAEMAANLKLLADQFKLMNRASMDAKVALSLEDIMSNYPKTYRARETDLHLAKETETFSANDLSGPYFLPIGSETTPLQAVRFGLRLLHEHIEGQKLDYTLRVNLDKAD